MKANLKELLLNQAEWQKSRKTDSWGDKIRQAEKARESLGSYGHRDTSVQAGKLRKRL